MKFALITTAYSSYLHNLYARHPGLGARPFAEQSRELFADSFGWSDYWVHALAPLGFETICLTANAESLQKAWASEHGIEVDEDWQRQIPLAQAEAFQPDVLFVVAPTVFSAAWIEEARRRCPSIRLVLGWCGAPMSSPGGLAACDLVLSCSGDLIQWLRDRGLEARELHHAFHPPLLERIDAKRAPNKPFTFFGQIAGGKDFHEARAALLARLARETPIQIYSEASQYGWSDALKFQLKKSLYAGAGLSRRLGLPEAVLHALPGFGQAARWDSAPRPSYFPALASALRPPLFGLAMYQALHDSQATFNSHIGVSPNYAANMRLFEATGAGACLVTDARKNLSSLFELDREVVAYASAEECVEKVNWLLAHPRECAEIARAGQARTLRDHTFTKRAEILVRWVRERV